MNKTNIIIAGIIMFAVLGFGYFDYAAKIRVVELQRQETIRQEDMKKINFNNCMDSAYNLYYGDWESKCELENLGKGCSLPKYQREDIEERWAVEKDRCTQLYK